ncbi:hypothetical protein N2152v2_009532 [Parachlorella kessleri]
MGQLEGKRTFQEPTDVAEVSVFEIQTVQRAVGGVSPCFLYKGCRAPAAAAQPAKKRRNRGPESPLAAWEQRQQQQEDQVVPGGNETGGGGSSPTADGDTESLTLYISFEEGSPSPKQRSSTPTAPFRVCLCDSRDELLVSYRGLPTKAYTDEQLRLVAWGPLTLRFPSRHDQRLFASCLRRVEIAEWDLSPSGPALPPPSPAARPAARLTPLPPARWACLAPSAAESSLSALLQQRVAQTPPHGQRGCQLSPGLHGQRGLPRSGFLPYSPPALAALAVVPAPDLPPLATPPPVNRCAQSGEVGLLERRVLAWPLPTPVPFVLPADGPVVSDVGAALATLEAGMRLERAWM